MRSPRIRSITLSFFALALLVTVACWPRPTGAQPVGTIISAPDGNHFLMYDHERHGADSATLAALGLDEQAAFHATQATLEALPLGAHLPALHNGDLVAGPDGATYLLLNGPHHVPNQETLNAYGWTGEGDFAARPIIPVAQALLDVLPLRAPIAAATRGADYQRFDWGYCTWWVAQRRSVPWLGDADEWYANAQAMGFAVGQTPVPGAILVTGPSAWSSVGHVAYVEAVSGATFTVSEMNVNGLGQLSTRTYDLNTNPPRAALGFIYWRYGAEPTSAPTDTSLPLPGPRVLAR
ncbi:MAG: CHAP domain-containing protein [Thermomicrobiales bacterium]